MCSQCPGNVRHNSPFLSGRPVREQELVCPFQNPQTGTRFASRLVVFSRHYPVSVSQMSHSALPWTRALLAVGSPAGACFWLQSRQRRCYPKCSRNNSVHVCGLDLTRQPLIWDPRRHRSQKLSLPGLGCCRGLITLRGWDPRAAEPGLQVMWASLLLTKRSLEAVPIICVKLRLPHFEER